MAHHVVYENPTKTKIKIISANNWMEFENAINEFIKDKNIIDIKYQSFVVPTQTNEYGALKALDINDRALIIYEERN